MNRSTHDDAWLFADAEAWKEFGEAYAAEFDEDGGLAVPLSEAFGQVPNIRGRRTPEVRAPRVALAGGVTA